MVFQWGTDDLAVIKKNTQPISYLTCEEKNICLFEKSHAIVIVRYLGILCPKNNEVPWGQKGLFSPQIVAPANIYL